MFMFTTIGIMSQNSSNVEQITPALITTASYDTNNANNINNDANNNETASYATAAATLASSSNNDVNTHSYS